MTYSPVFFRRSAVYFKKLVDISGEQAKLQMIINAEKYKYELETRRGEDLARVYDYIERNARGGAVRVMNWGTPALEKKLIFDDKEIKTYLMSNGFSYSDNSLEWWHAKEHQGMK